VACFRDFCVEIQADWENILGPYSYKIKNENCDAHIPCSLFSSHTNDSVPLSCNSWDFAVGKGLNNGWTAKGSGFSKIFLRPEREAVSSRTTSVEAKKILVYISTPLYASTTASVV
jgi:hypothetical protein